MKNLCFILLVICLTGTGCKKEQATDTGCGKLEINENEYITMQILPKEVSANSENKLRFENCTKQTMTYGTNFYLEYLDKNRWIPVETDMGFLAKLYVLMSGGTKDTQECLYLLPERYNFEKGRYKMIKEISLRNMGKYNICAEFEIK